MAETSSRPLKHVRNGVIRDQGKPVAGPTKSTIPPRAEAHVLAAKSSAPPAPNRDRGGDA
jgi:hypothetical protein